MFFLIPALLGGLTGAAIVATPSTKTIIVHRCHACEGIVSTSAIRCRHCGEVIK
jgi:hypothetical protein